MEYYTQLNAIFGDYGLRKTWLEEELKERVDNYFLAQGEDLNLDRFCDYMIASFPHHPKQRVAIEDFKKLTVKMPALKNWGKEEELFIQAFMVGFGDDQKDFHLNFDIDSIEIWQLDISHPVMRRFYQHNIPEILWREFQIMATFNPERARYLVYQATVQKVTKMKKESLDFEAPELLKERLVEKLTHIYQTKIEEIEAAKKKKRKLFGISLPLLKKKAN